MEERVEGLDIVDFPGVDDRDESISELADLLLTLAQIIIFVVDYRYVSSEASLVPRLPLVLCLLTIIIILTVHVYS